MFEPQARGQVLDLGTFPSDQLPSLGDVSHPVQAYLNSLAPSSRRPQLSALDWIGRRSTQLYTAETMPWHRLPRAHVLKIRGLLEEHYQPATANRMLSALRGVLSECWQAQLISIEDYQAAISSQRCAGSQNRAAATSPPASSAAFSWRAATPLCKDAIRTLPSAAA